MDTPVFIHVGFANTGTTSLQRNFFAAREDILFVGEPFLERGGIFTAIKSREDFQLDRGDMAAMCQRLIYEQAKGRPVVISDEALCDTPELYFAPYTMPRDVIALRLQNLFPAAKIIFTIRDQRHYATSMYFNLKRNAAFFDRMPVPVFSDWLTGCLSQIRTNYLYNLNFMDSIGLYTRIFGRENLCILPLETVILDGARPYLTKLCRFMDLKFRDQDVGNYDRVHNRRMSVRRELISELLADERFQQLYGELIEEIGDVPLGAFIDEGPRASLRMSASDESKIRERAGRGNRLLARLFDLDLERYGYAMIADEALTARERALAEQELRLEAETNQLNHAAPNDKLLELRRFAEMASLQSQLRELASELATVGQSPVWRTVKRLDSARRFLERVAALCLNVL